MTDPDREHRTGEARATFQEMWARGNPWRHESSAFDQTSYARQLELLAGRRYRRALEFGCGSGHFTVGLARVADRILAVDVAPSAIELARRTAGDEAAIEFRVADAVELDVQAEGPWDLIVMSETLSSLGSLHSFYDVAALAMRLHEATVNGGRFLMANTIWERDLLTRTELVRTYRDLMVNVGYRLEVEETIQGAKDGVHLEAVVSLLAKDQ